MGVQRAINGQLITWEVIVYGFLGMEQVAARYKDPWKAAVYCCGSGGRNQLRAGVVPAGNLFAHSARSNLI